MIILTVLNSWTAYLCMVAVIMVFMGKFELTLLAIVLNSSTSHSPAAKASLRQE
jgi:hypothetical protein